MRISRLIMLLAGVCLLLNLPFTPSLIHAAPPELDYHQHEMPALPTPKWVSMIDQGNRVPELRGMRTPDGVHVDIVAREPVIVDPVGMAFDDQGTAYVLEWREATEQVDVTYTVNYRDGTSAQVNRKQKNALDHFKRLIDADNDGHYEDAELLMDDLEYPSSVLIHDSWNYFPSVGHVIRRRSDGSGGYITEEILRGMCGYHHHQVSGLTLSADNWMYTTTGDDDNRAEGSDGSRATVLRTGAIFRSRPDGSKLYEFARGFRNPYRNVVFDETFNMFHVDNDQEDGSKFQGVRLMHILEGADYGWRLEFGAKCCRTDFDRGAVFGERPGKMPSMLKVGRGAPAGLLIYQQSRFPDFFRGLLIYPDCYRRLVRAYEVERRGSSFAVVSEFVLMESDDDLFRPIQAVAGPDGAIYILDWHTDSGGAGKSWGDNKHGRIYRLSWGGTQQHPAIPLGDRNAWRKQSDLTSQELIQQLESDDFELRVHAQRKLVANHSLTLNDWATIFNDSAKPAGTRALAISAAAQSYGSDVESAFAQLLQTDKDPEIRRLAAECIGRESTGKFNDGAILDALTRATNADDHLAVRRAAAMALGAIAATSAADSSHRSEIAKALFDAAWTYRQHSADETPDVWLTDGYVRGLERCGQPAIDLLASQITSPANAEKQELAISILEAMRTRPAANGLDQVLAQDDQLSDEQLLRMIETYRHILVDPPIKANGVQEWLLRRTTASSQLRVAALQTLAMTGANADSVQELAIQLLEDPDPLVRVAAIQSIGESRMMDATRPLVSALRQPTRNAEEKRLIVESLGMLRAQGWPYLDRSDPGVELVVKDLVQLMGSDAGKPILGDLISLVGQVDLEQARGPAETLLESGDPQAVAAAIDVIGTEQAAAQQIATRFLAGNLPASVKPNVAAAVQRHLPNDQSGQLAEIVTKLFQDGLNVSLDPAEVDRIETLVKETGNPEQGKSLYLDIERSQCAKCHRLEGTGGDIGPDLTRIWQTHSVAKILESIVEPSREIKEGFANWTAETKAGQVYAGLKVSDTTAEVVLRDANGRDIRIPRDQLESLDETRQSLMPVGTVTQLSFTELIDLLAFLKNDEAQRSLRQRQSSK